MEVYHFEGGPVESIYLLKDDSVGMKINTVVDETPAEDTITPILTRESDRWRIKTDHSWETMIFKNKNRKFKDQFLEIDDSIQECNEYLDKPLSNFERGDAL